MLSLESKEQERVDFLDDRLAEKTMDPLQQLLSEEDNPKHTNNENNAAQYQELEQKHKTLQGMFAQQRSEIEVLKARIDEQSKSQQGNGDLKEILTQLVPNQAPAPDPGPQYSEEDLANYGPVIEMLDRAEERLGKKIPDSSAQDKLFEMMNNMQEQMKVLQDATIATQAKSNQSDLFRKVPGFSDVVHTSDFSDWSRDALIAGYPVTTLLAAAAEDNRPATIESIFTQYKSDRGLGEDNNQNSDETIGQGYPPMGNAGNTQPVINPNRSQKDQKNLALVEEKLEEIRQAVAQDPSKMRDLKGDRDKLISLKDKLTAGS